MLLSELEYGAFLSYSPRGTSAAAEESRMWCRALKDESQVGQPPRSMSSLVAERLRARLPDSVLAPLFSARTVLVPVPKSGLMKLGDLWVPNALARALAAVGLAGSVSPCLRRRHAVRKSATAPAEERARPQEHYESLIVEPAFPAPDEILVVDDVITRGATLLAAASRLHDAYPNAHIRGFAVVRTISAPDEFQSVLAPVIGCIRLSLGNAYRTP